MAEVAYHVIISVYHIDTNYLIELAGAAVGSEFHSGAKRARG
jgi:hypothetical protein